MIFYVGINFFMLGYVFFFGDMIFYVGKSYLFLKYNHIHM